MSDLSRSERFRLCLWSLKIARLIRYLLHLDCFVVNDRFPLRNNQYTIKTRTQFCTRRASIEPESSLFTCARMHCSPLTVHSQRGAGLSPTQTRSILLLESYLDWF